MIKRLKQLRKKLHLTQEEFGKQIGRGQGCIASWESRGLKIPEAAILQICRTFNVSRDWFVDGVGDMFNKPTAIYVDDPEDMTVDNVIRWFICRYNKLPREIQEELRQIVTAVNDRVMKGAR